MRAHSLRVHVGLLAVVGSLVAVRAANGQHLQRLIGNFTDERFNGGVAFGAADFISVGQVRSTTGEVNMLVSRLNNAGKVLWARLIGTTDYDEAFSVVTTTDGNVIVAGVSASDLSRTIILVKLDPAGGVIWSNKYSGNCLSDSVASFHPVVINGPQGQVYVVAHNIVTATGGPPQQFGRALVVQANGVATTDLQFAQAAEPPRLSPSDVVSVNFSGFGQAMVICGTKVFVNTGTGVALRSGFTTVFAPNNGFFVSMFYNGVAAVGGPLRDLSFNSIATDSLGQVLYLDGEMQANTGSALDATLQRIPLAGAPTWSWAFDSITPAQAALRLRDAETLVWAGTHAFGDGGRLAQMQATRTDATQLWNYQYPFPTSSGSGGLVIAPPLRDNVVFGDAFDLAMGYGQTDGLFLRADSNGKLQTTQCAERILPTGFPWIPATNQFAITSIEVPVQRPWEMTSLAIPLRDTVVCPTPIVCCIADVATDSLDVVYNPNGSIGPEDLDAFIAGFIAANVLIADVATDSLDTTCNPNGAVGPEDLDAFIASFINGCP